MIVDFSDLKEVGSKKKYTAELDVDHIDFRNREIEIDGPLTVELDVLKTERSFVLSGELEGVLILQCSRCLKYFEHPIEVEISDELSIEDIEDLHNIDLFPIFERDIILEIPIKPLHDEDCKGLCPICGQDLNKEECDCEKESIDPRLEKLKEFKQK
ncbi:MAG: YceD family protein [Halanaerobiales bacterium]|nr:YceD family protein [Halanaerobiales bacterium]